VPKIELDKATRDQLSRLIAEHLKAELDLEVAPFDALDLLDFLSERLGPHYYNQGLYDAQVALKGKVDLIIEAIEQLEQPLRLK
jgi:uncharacterized protein (DUF2164 family)